MDTIEAKIAAKAAEQPEHATREELAHVHSRLDTVERFLERVLHKVESVLGMATPAAAAAAAAVHAIAPGSSAAAGAAVVAGAVQKLEELVDAVPCPDHPDAPQTANGCTADGCTFSPAQ